MHVSFKCGIFLILLFLAACSNRPSYPAPSRIGNDIAVDVETLKTDLPAFFSFHYKGKKVNFFVLKSGGSFSSFLDACATCYPAKKGYRFEGGRIICNECNVGFSAAELERGMGGCFPIRLEGRLDNGRYLIPVSSLEDAADKYY